MLEGFPGVNKKDGTLSTPGAREEAWRGNWTGRASALWRGGWQGWGWGDAARCAAHKILGGAKPQGQARGKSTPGRHLLGGTMVRGCRSEALGSDSDSTTGGPDMSLNLANAVGIPKHTLTLTHEHTSVY